MRLTSTVQIIYKLIIQQTRIKLEGEIWQCQDMALDNWRFEGAVEIALINKGNTEFGTKDCLLHFIKCPNLVIVQNH